MENHPAHNYSRLAIGIVVAAGILGAASLGSSLSRAATTSTATSTFTSTSISTLVSTWTATSILTTTATVTLVSTNVSTATSLLTVDSVDQNGQTAPERYTVLGGVDGSVVIAEGLTPGATSIAAGQTYDVRAESNGSCTFKEWSDGAASDPRSFVATGAPVSLTAVYACGGVPPPSAIVQSCVGYSPDVGAATQTSDQTASATTVATTTTTELGPPTQSIGCRMGSGVRAGDLIVVKISDVPGINFSDSMGNSFTLLEKDLASSTYYSFIYYAIASSSGPDTLTVQGYGNYPSIMAVELQGLHTISDFEAASGDSNVASVGAFTPPATSFVVAFVEPLGPPISVSAGAGYTLAALYAVSNACEYGTVTGQTTSPFTLGASTEWEEVSLVFS